MGCPQDGESRTWLSSAGDRSKDIVIEGIVLVGEEIGIRRHRVCSLG